MPNQSKLPTKSSRSSDLSSASRNLWSSSKNNKLSQSKNPARWISRRERLMRDLDSWTYNTKRRNKRIVSASSRSKSFAGSWSIISCSLYSSPSINQAASKTVTTSAWRSLLACSKVPLDSSQLEPRSLPPPTRKTSRILWRWQKMMVMTTYRKSM